MLPSGGDGLLVPFYNLHKVLAGLLDAHQQAPAERVGQGARRSPRGFGTWVRDWAGRQANPAALLGTEYGGMNEALYELYSITENPAHKRAAEYFDEVALFQQLAAGQDVLERQARQHDDPEARSARSSATRSSPTTRDLYATLTAAEKSNLGMYRTAAENFWQMVVDDHTYANGGNSQSEHFHGADTLYEHATNGDDLGLRRELDLRDLQRVQHAQAHAGRCSRSTKDVKYADFYEYTYINTILAQQNPETGMVTYFQPMTAGYAKVFGNPLDEFWCDHGTAIESFTKLGDSIYFRKGESSVYVNMFRSSVLTTPRSTTSTHADRRRPEPTTTVTFTVEALDGGAVADGTDAAAARARAGSTGTPTLTVNGEAQDVAPSSRRLPRGRRSRRATRSRYVLPAKVTVDDGDREPELGRLQVRPGAAGDRAQPHQRRRHLRRGRARAHERRRQVGDQQHRRRPTPRRSRQTIAEQPRPHRRRRERATASTTMRFGLKNVDAASAGADLRAVVQPLQRALRDYMNLVEPDSAEAQALILKGKEQLRIAETTIDSLTSFDNNNSEADKNYKFNKSGGRRVQRRGIPRRARSRPTRISSTT